MPLATGDAPVPANDTARRRVRFAPSLVTDPGPYRAPAWLPGGNLQTLYAALCAPRPRVEYVRERWDTPDGDFVDVDLVAPPSSGHAPSNASPLDTRAASTQGPSPSPGARAGSREAGVRRHAPLVVLFHGLEGCSTSHYAHALMALVRAIGWHGAVVHFRGCSGEPNRLPRAYHSGDSIELDWMLRRLRKTHRGPLYAAGVSLGGNVLLKWAGEQAARAAEVVHAAAAVSAPLDLMRAGDALGSGFNRIYTYAFLKTLKRKALGMHERHPGLFDLGRARAAATLRDFDDVVTAPLHGYLNTDDYWTRASSKPFLRDIAVPMLIVNARNDPFMPAAALPAAHEVSSHVTLEFPEEGGHAGFVSGAFPGRLDWLPRRIITHFSAHSPAP